MTRNCFWAQYTYGIGFEEYGSFETIEDAVKAPFLHSESTKTEDGRLICNVDGRVLMICDGESVKTLGYQQVQLNIDDIDSLVWQNYAKNHNSFVPVKNATEIFEAHRKK